MTSRKLRRKRPPSKKRSRLSARQIQDLRSLAEQIGKIIPATSPRRGGFCFQTIAKDVGLAKYWPARQQTKKEAIFEFLRKVYQEHPRTTYRLFRENFARGIERRQKAGDPVLLEEMQALNGTLRRLNVNLSKEIEELDLPTERPRIVPPPYAFQRMVDDLGLHPLLMPQCAQLFKDGHINESVRKALEKYEKYVQGKAGLTKIGTDLMAHAFNENNPAIEIANRSTKRGLGLQEGFKFISMGSMGFWRNFCTHGDEEQMSHADAIAALATVSHLLAHIDATSGG
jgi:uncharacterized protein (TIGR02391 family)